MGQTHTDPSGRKRSSTSTRAPRGSRLSARHREQSQHAIQSFCRKHRLSGATEEILVHVAIQADLRQKPAMDYSVQQLASATGRVFSTLRVAMGRLTSLGVARVIELGHRGRKRATVWEINRVGPTFLDVAETTAARALTARKKCRRPSPPSLQEQAPSEPTPILLPQKKPMGGFAPGTPEANLVSATILAGFNPGGATRATEALRGFKPEELTLLAGQLPKVIEALAKEAGVRCPRKVYVHRCRNGRGAELIKMASSSAKESSRPPVVAPPPREATEMVRLAKARLNALPVSKRRQWAAEIREELGDLPNRKSRKHIATMLLQRFAGLRTYGDVF